VLLPNRSVDNVETDIVAIEEVAAKRWLSTHDVNVPTGVLLITDGLNAAQLADYISKQCATLQWPVVLKSTGSLHKSDSGGVILGIEDQQQLSAAMQTMGCASFFVEQQVNNVVCELLVGIVRDPVHGFLMTIGAGGVQTELLSDTVSGLLPLTQAQLRSMLATLRCYPVLNGYRGRPGCDWKNMLDTLMKIQQAATSVADDLYELEINPLICTAQGTLAADALLRIDAQSSHNRD